MIRKPHYDYPLDAIREIVINMLVHRDYRDSNGSIIKIYDDKIEFYNPGGLYGDLTEQELLKFNYQPQARNKLIAKAFKEIGKVERYGSGVKRIFTICKDHEIIPPQINVKRNSFEVVLFKQKLNDTVSEGINEGINERQKQVIELLQINNTITIMELASKVIAGRETIKRDLKKLKDLKIIERIGSDKTGYWNVL